MTDSMPGAKPRRKVLISAYACGPSDEPEASAGWGYAVAAAQEHDVWVITRHRFMPAVDRALAANPELARHLHVIPIDLSSKVQKLRRHSWDLYWYYAIWQRKLARTAAALHRDIGFDVAHHVTFANDWLPCGVSGLSEVPFVWGPVGGASDIPYWRLRRWLGTRGIVTEVVRDAAVRLPRRLFGDRAARRARIVVAQNNDVARRFHKAAEVIVEPNAALDLSAVPARVPKSGQPRSRSAIVVSRLIPWKGVRIALHAVARTDPGTWTMEIYGSGPLRASLEAEAETLGIGDRVIFRGHRPRSDVLAAMAEADVLVFPSMHDQAGWVAAEASTMGLPVVCLPLGGPPILADRNAFIADLEGDLAANVAAKMEDAVAVGGTPTSRWSAARLPHLVRDWYGTALDSHLGVHDDVPVGKAAGYQKTTRNNGSPPLNELPTLRVLESVTAITSTTNPYLTQLVESLRRLPDVSVQLFSFKAAVLGRYDVLHIHWPEVMFGGHRPLGRLARRILTTLLMVRLSVTGTPVVRTWHNTERPQGISKWDHRLLDAVDKRTTVVIRLNEVTDVPLPVSVRTVPLGHYREWYGSHPAAPAVPGRVAYVGLIRRYKGVEDLVAAFLDVRTPGATLAICGKPSTPELADSIRRQAGNDKRISFRPEFLDDADFVAAVTSATLLVLPFVHMHNSSTVLAALSLDRPVLVPHNEVNRRLADEVGPGWIFLYDESLGAGDIENALSAINAHTPKLRPCLDARTWEFAAKLHVEAFRSALDRSRSA